MLPRRIVYLALLPPQVLHVLHPFEVRDHHATRVGKYVGDHEDTLVVEHLVGDRRGRAVRALQQDLAAHPIGVAFVDHSSKRGGHEHVALDVEQLLRGDRLGSLVLRQLAAVDDEAVEIRGSMPASLRSAPSAFETPTIFTPSWCMMLAVW